MRIAATMDLQGEQAAAEWHKIADFLDHLGHDPNWRRRPSVLDQMRGWLLAYLATGHSATSSSSLAAR